MDDGIFPEGCGDTRCQTTSQQCFEFACEGRLERYYGFTEGTDNKGKPNHLVWGLISIGAFVFTFVLMCGCKIISISNFNGCSKGLGEEEVEQEKTFAYKTGHSLGRKEEQRQATPVPGLIRVQQTVVQQDKTRQVQQQRRPQQNQSPRTQYPRTNNTNRPYKENDHPTVHSRVSQQSGSKHSHRTTSQHDRRQQRYPPQHLKQQPGRRAAQTLEANPSRTQPRQRDSNMNTLQRR
mmetsp:Transcript_33172/g.47101  ORF Transcript_33172/g.47101 Transcript_33172/m.47101 type:complete len:236 (+) Transcript_33172:431-1138(+)